MKRRPWCDAHSYRERLYGSPMGGPPEKGSLPRWLAAMIERSVTTEDCILDWPGHRTAKGYPQIRKDGKLQPAYHVVMEMTGRPRPDGLQVRHLCGRGTEGCLHPRHIAWGTHQENVADRTTQGKERRGEAKPGAKLTEADVRAIRSSSEGSRALGRRYGVDSRVIRRIIARERWMHVE